jgi:hypothetical protein
MKKHSVLCAGAFMAVSCALESPAPEGANGGRAGAASGQGGLGSGGSGLGGKATAGSSAGGADSAGKSGAGGSGTSGSSGGGSSGRSGDGGDQATAGAPSEAGAGGEAGVPHEPDDDCAADPCLNGGTCVDGDNDYTCDCKDGYDGHHCEDNIDDCAGVTCENEGTCVDGVGTHTCACANRYTGPACEFLEIKLVGTDFYLGEVTRVTALSNDGRVALLNVTGDGGDWVAKLVDFESVVGVEFTGLQTSGRYAFGISEDGGVIAGQVIQGGPTYVPFKLVGTVPSILDLEPLPAPATGSNAIDVSADGTTIVGVSRDSETGKAEAFRYRAAGSEYVGNWLTSEGAQEARAVSGDGSVVAGVATGANALPARAWRWSAGTTTTLELKATTWTRPLVNDISRDGQVIVGEVSINGVLHAVRWIGSGGTAEDLGTGAALGTNADGSITVGHDNSGNAVVWSGTTKRTLASILGSNPDIVGSLAVAVGVSDDGKVVAGDVVADDKYKGFMARLP